MVVTLKEISNIVTGHVFRNKIAYSLEGNVNLLNMDAISKAGKANISNNDVKKVIARDLRENEIIKAEDILFKAKGLNNISVLINTIPSNTTVTASCHIVRLTDNNYLPEYVCAMMNGIAAKKHFAKASGKASGVTISNVSKQTLETLKIPKIPLSKQKIIAGFIECAEKEHELSLKIADKKETLNRTIIKKELNRLGA